MPPLPHHRAYGSVPRRFGGLSAHQRLHGEQAMIFEAFVAEGAMHRACRTQTPGSLWTEDSRMYFRGRRYSSSSSRTVVTCRSGSAFVDGVFVLAVVVRWAIGSVPQSSLTV
jgi:hypothetical protein